VRGGATRASPTRASIRKPARRENRRVDSLDHRFGGLVEQDCRGHFRRRRRGLDPESALPRTPEKSGRVGVESVDREPVFREAAQARPASLDPLDRPVDDRLESVDRPRNVDFLGRRVAWIGRYLVVRAEPHRAVAFTLEIKGALRVIDERQVAQP